MVSRTLPAARRLVNTPPYGPKCPVGSSARRRGKSRALGAADWVAAALEAIRKDGIEAVAVEPLARKLRVTKGSFYWHFTDRDAWLTAALRRWEELETEAIIAGLACVDDPGERLKLLLMDITDPSRDYGVELALFRAGDHRLVRPVLRRVVARRMAYVEECYRALGLTGAEARRRAFLAYTAYVGFLHLRPEAAKLLSSGEELAAFRQHVIDTLIAGPPKPG